ncbi:MAG: N-acetyltransferase [Planctomycetota bacterium]
MDTGWIIGAAVALPAVVGLAMMMMMARPGATETPGTTETLETTDAPTRHRAPATPDSNGSAEPLHRSGPSAPAVTITAFRFTDRRLFRQFLKLPRALYAGDPNWVPEFLIERNDFHNPAKQPIRRPMDITYFLATRNGQTVGRITAHSYPAHNATHNENVGFFGFFECIDDADVAAALFDAAAARLTELGFDTMRGPCDFCTNEEVGSLVWADREEPAAVMMKYNPRYHQALYEGAGFGKAKDLWAYDIRTDKWPNEKIQRVAALARKRGATLRQIRLDKKTWKEELGILNSLYRQAWQANWGFVPLSDEEFAHISTEMRMILDPAYALIAEVDGRPVAWALTFPDIHQILRHTNGGALRTIWHMLIRKTQRRWDVIDRVRIAILGVIPEFRKRGIDAMFYERIFEVSINHARVTYGETSWVLENNAEMVNGSRMMQATHYKTYRLYDRPLSAVPTQS